MPLPEGLYEQLLTEGLHRRLDLGRAELQEVSGDAGVWLVDAIARQLGAILEDLDGSAAAPTRQAELVNGMLVALRERLTATERQRALAALVDPIPAPPRVLRAIRGRRPAAEAPQTGLSVPWLFTAGKGSPSLLQEIRRELASADRVDILVSFITVSGVRKLHDVLQQVSAVGADGEAPTRLRILTTTYTGATEARALDELARLPSCEVRVSLDGRCTRLHAKARLFHRASGFGSAYVGSANLSGAALTGGLEWTLKITQRAQEPLFTRAAAHFETLWADSEFQRYDPDDAHQRQALAAALRREAGAVDGAVTAAFFDLQPKTYQQDMLEQLAAERAHGRHRNLVVAATGTCKTVVAAFDYRRLCQQVGGRPRLLFVAHREEILVQARRTYREVLRDHGFGELLTGAHRPEHWDHVFATIDSVTSRQVVATLGAEHWHVVVVDECHRLAAERFETFMTAVRPRVLLGLTATPERSDGLPIAQHFDARPDGSPAVELRLWHALDLQLLAPFEYYACDDDTDFSQVPWDRPAERDAIDRLVTGNDVRARLVVDEWRRLASDPRRSRALVFCVSIAHAEFMADRLNRAGLPAACVVGTTDADERRRAPERLARGELCALVTVDLYNEGVDLPTVDTLLMLRPTQSPVLFQQQIGRGLRLAPGKESCLVLDFVGHHRMEFRFDRLLGSLTGLSRRELVDGVEHGFGSLPPGCHIHLERQTREQVLRSLRELTAQNWRRLTAELQAHVALRGRASVRLADFLHDQALDLEDVYRAGTGGARSGWTVLKRDAGLIAAEPGPEEAYFSRRFADLLHVDDPLRLDLLAAVGADPRTVDDTDRRRALALQMLAYQIDGRHEQRGSHRAFLARLARERDARAELAELAGVLQARSTLAAQPVPGLEDTPLVLHASYGIREVLTAVGWLTAERRTPFRAGVLPLPARETELLFVTLDKSEAVHDRLAYRDYAISTGRFHWQTQNSAGPDTPGGRRYLDSPGNNWQFQLFVRARKGEPYRACGRVLRESHEGDRPMSIVWRLDTPLPAALFREFSVLRGVCVRGSQRRAKRCAIVHPRAPARRLEPARHAAHRSRPGRRAARRVVHARPRRHARADRRVGLRQVDHRAGADGAAARRREGVGLDPARRPGADGARRSRLVRPARAAHRHGVPGADDGAQPAAHDRPPGRRAAARAPGAVGRRRARRGATPARARAPAAGRAPARRVPAPALGRAAPARRDRDRAGLRARPAARRRADDGARRDDPARGARSDRRARRRKRHGAAADQPRPRRDGDKRAPHARDVRRHRRRGRADQCRVRAPRAPVHARPLRGAPAARARTRHAPGDDPGARARTRRPARRLRLRRSLRARRRRVPARAARAGDGGRSAPRALRARARTRGMTTSAPLLQVERVHKQYRLPRERLLAAAPVVHAVDDVSFTLRAGRSLGVVGESGSGKSTLARLVMALERPTSGRIVFDGHDLNAVGADALKRLRTRLQMVFQDPYGSLDPRRTVGQTVAEPLTSLQGVGRDEARRRVAEALDAVGLRAADAAKYPHEFSGGQRQRIAIARALVTRPSLIVADEPVSALDVSVQAQVLNLMQDLQDAFGVTYLFISHDLAVVDLVCDDVVVLYQGRVVEHANADVLSGAPAHPYTRALLDAVPPAAPSIGRTAPAATAAGPAPIAAPAACAFAARCPWRHERCLREAPPLREVAPGHLAACHVAESVLRHAPTTIA